MKIIGVKGDLTKNIHEIAFVVDSAPDPDVLANIRTKLQLSFRDGHLFAQAPGDHDVDPPIVKRDIEHINAQYADGALKKQRNLEMEAREHARALEDVQRLTGLEVQ